MKVTRLIVVCGTLITVTGAHAQQSASPKSPDRHGARQGTAAPASPSNTNASSPSSDQNHGQSFLKRLAGEWEGQVQVRGSDGMNSASIVSASNRLANGNLLECSLSGFAFGKSFEGASVLKLDGASLSGSWVDSNSNRTYRSACESRTCTNDSATLSSSGSPPSANPATEQSFTMVDENHFVYELCTIGPEGRRTLQVRLDMTRLPHGQVTDASSRFKDAPLLGRLRSEHARNAQASADKGE